MPRSCKLALILGLSATITSSPRVLKLFVDAKHLFLLSFTWRLQGGERITDIKVRVRGGLRQNLGPARSPFFDPFLIVKYHTVQYGGERAVCAASGFRRRKLGKNFNSQFRNGDGRSFFILSNEPQQRLRRDPCRAQGHTEQPTAATLARRNTIETPRGFV